MPSFSRRDIFSLAGKGAALGALMVQVSTSALAVSSDVKSPYKINKLIHGVAYYPELWPDADVDADIAEMQSLGINLVRMAEFAWSTMETTPGNYDFSLFKNVMDKMHAAGIAVVLCTPTATPPAWLTHNHPERCHKNADGTVMSHGARQHASYEHPAVREACFNIIRRMSHELGRHPALIGWQLDNEMKAHVAEDFSDAYDFMEALIYLCKHEKTGRFVLSSNKLSTIQDLIHLTGKKLGINNIKIISNNPQKSYSLTGDNKKLLSTGFQFNSNIIEALHRMTIEIIENE